MWPKKKKKKISAT